MRNLLVAILSALLACGSLAATLGSVQLRDFELRGYSDPTRDAELPFAIERPGVNVELLQYDESSLRHNLEMISSAQFRWIRQYAYWDEVEAREGERDWRAWDRAARVLADFPKLRTVVVFMNSPAWARVDDPALSESAPPQDLNAFAAFVEDFASRYGDLVDHYQIWDEPNLSEAWGGMDPRPAEYMALLSAGRDAILRADPDAVVIGAALAPTTETGGRNISDLRYLEALYALGAVELMDVVAGKPYGFSTSALDRRVDESLLNFSRIVALRELMKANGDGRKMLWASHFGWNALPAGWTGETSIWGAVSLEERVAYTLQALDRAHREWPWLGVMFLHHWQPAAHPESAQWGFSLLDPDGEPTALLKALATYPYPQRAQNGLHHPRTQHARYSGVWQFSERGADIGWLGGGDSQLELDFYGRDLALLLREDDYFAFLYPTVDGVPANAAQKDSGGNAYIVLRSNTRQPELNLAPVAKDLALDAHTLHAAADRGWDRWAIAGYAVSSGDLSAPYQGQIAAGAAATVMSFATLLFALGAAPWREWIPLTNRALSGLSAGVHLIAAGLTSVFMLFAMLWTWQSPRWPLLLREDVNILLALATGGALHLTSGAMVSLLLGLVLVALIYHRLETGLILTLFWAPFFLTPVALYHYAFPMVEVMILATAAAGAARWLAWLGTRLQTRNSAFPLISRRALNAITGMDLAVICLGGLGLLSLLWTTYSDPARTELRTLLAEPILFYALLRCATLNKSALTRLAASLVVAGVIVSVYGLYQYFIGDAVITAEYGARRLQSVYGSPNNVGLLLGRAIPIALALALAWPGRRGRWLAAGGLLVMAPTLLLTQSAGAIALGVPAGVALVILGCYGKRALIPLALMVAAGVLAFMALTQVSARFANALDFSSGTNFVRLRLWESSAAMLAEAPLTGIGMDQFLYLYGGEYLKPDVIHDSDLSHPHNFILDFWTRLGILGLAAFVAAQALFWRAALYALRVFRQGDRQLFALTLGLMGSMAALLAHGMIDNSVFVIDLAFIFMFQLAAMVRLREMAGDS